MTFTIHVATARARKGGTHYRARAYVAQLMDSRIVKHSFSIAIDDIRDTAALEAVDYIKAMYHRDDLTPPANVRDHGTLSSAQVDNFLFGESAQ